MSVNYAEVSQLNEQLSGLDLTTMLIEVAQFYPGQVTFSSSFGMEDQVITDAIATSNAPISIFTLDTGRLFNETYSVWSATLDKYKLRIKSFGPDNAELNAWLEANGPNAFYTSVDNRKACCRIRKVIPLRAALSGHRVWITGIRAEQSGNREKMPMVEWDDNNGILKLHPLVDWTQLQVRHYLQQHEVPYNPLHDKGFVSIGCSPCTRAIKPGEDFRAGRWWWEDDSKKECGLHSSGNH